VLKRHSWNIHFVPNKIQTIWIVHSPFMFRIFCLNVDLDGIFLKAVTCQQVLLKSQLSWSYSNLAIKNSFQRISFLELSITQIECGQLDLKTLFPKLTFKSKQRLLWIFYNWNQIITTKWTLKLVVLSLLL
jgi:hypothetical protein